MSKITKKEINEKIRVDKGRFGEFFYCYQDQDNYFAACNTDGYIVDSNGHGYKSLWRINNKKEFIEAIYDYLNRVGM